MSELSPKRSRTRLTEPGAGTFPGKAGDGAAASDRRPAHPVRGPRPPARSLWLIRWGSAALFLVVVVVFYLNASSGYLYNANYAMYAAVGAIALNLLTGYAGQLSLGNAAFLGIGAYTVVIVGEDLPFLVTLVIAALVAGLVGLLIGVPSLRLRGLYLVFSTLALHFVANFLFRDYEDRHKAVAGFYVPPPEFGPWVIDSDQEWFVVFGVTLILVSAFVVLIVRGQPGRSWSLLVQNELAAAVVGVNTAGAKLVAFSISSAILGLAGALGAYFLQSVTSIYYSLDLAILYIAMILIGGMRSVVGSIIGAVVVSSLPFVLTQIFLGESTGEQGYFAENMAAFQLIIYGVIVLMILYARPDGVVSLLKSLGVRIAALGRPRSAWGSR